MEDAVKKWIMIVLAYSVALFILGFYLGVNW
jgi:hypothetical protein